MMIVFPRKNYEETLRLGLETYDKLLWTKREVLGSIYMVFAPHDLLHWVCIWWSH